MDYEFQENDCANILYAAAERFMEMVKERDDLTISSDNYGIYLGTLYIHNFHTSKIYQVVRSKRSEN